MAGKSLPLGLTRASVEALAFMLDLGGGSWVFALPVASQRLPANPRQMLLVLLLS
jgi:hypothetical protein